MQNKLQELTDQLFREGLAKGKEEGEKILSEANARASEVLSKANADAEAILRKAESDAAALKSKAESDVRMASLQALQTTKKDIENLLLEKAVSSKVEEALKDSGFVKQLIAEVAGHFSSSSEPTDLELLLPEKMKSELEPWVAAQLSKDLNCGVEASFSKKINGGFNIGPKNGGYYVSLSEETFKSLIKEYLRPVTRKILFGE